MHHIEKIGFISCSSVFSFLLLLVLFFRCFFFCLNWWIKDARTFCQYVCVCVCVVIMFCIGISIKSMYVYLFWWSIERPIQFQSFELSLLPNRTSFRTGCMALPNEELKLNCWILISCWTDIVCTLQSLNLPCCYLSLSCLSFSSHFQFDPAHFISQFLFPHAHTHSHTPYSFNWNCLPNNSKYWISFEIQVPVYWSGYR